MAQATTTEDTPIYHQVLRDLGMRSEWLDDEPSVKPAVADQRRTERPATRRGKRQKQTD